MFWAALRRNSISDCTLKNAACGVRITLGVAEQSCVGDGLDRQHVKTGAGKYSTIECAKQIVDVDHRAARGVDQKRACTHAAEHAGVDHAAGLVVERRMQADDVALREQAGEVGALDVRRKVAVDQVGIARDHALEDVARNVRHALADAAQPDDAQRHVARAPERARRKVVPLAGLDVAVVRRRRCGSAPARATSACVDTSPTP